MSVRAFDLNIEEVLENWQVEHALREIIANALDEQVISQTAEIQISSDEAGDWHIRDFGRGLRIQHFTLKENREKLGAPSGVIGKFGVGLKDALATFHRRGVGVLIRSSFGTYRLRQEHKVGFDDILTLHVDYDDTPNSIQGTEFILRGVTAATMASAKALFLKFAGEEVLETNDYGQILRRKAEAARVYILGVAASEEPNFLFSYNINSLTASMRAKLNRERLNVGRSTYSERVRSILKNAKSDAVEEALVEQVAARAAGSQADEMGWIDISQMALNLLHQRRRVAYLTEGELQSNPGVLTNATSDGYEIVVITDQQKAKLTGQPLVDGPPVRTLEQYVHEYNESFEYRFIAPAALTSQERLVYEKTREILRLVELSDSRIPEVRISETMRVTSDDTDGVWDRSIPAIVVKRSKLGSVDGYAATLLHEVGHAVTGTGDATREFEKVLTEYLGKTAKAALMR